MKRALRYIVAPAAAAMLALPAAATPASAHPIGFKLELGDLGYGWVNASHNEVWACDTSPDGLGIRTVLGNGRYVRDRNGSQSGCGKRQVPGGIDKIKVCATQSLEIVTCTRYHRA